MRHHHSHPPGRRSPGRAHRRFLVLALAGSLAAALAAGTTGLGAAAAPPPAPAQAVPAAPAPSPVVLRNLEAFVRLYGYVRWFHPSDESAAVDWDRMAVLGAERIAAAPDLAALTGALAAFFAPVAPSLRVYRDGETPPPLAAPPASGGSGGASGSAGQGAWQTIAWQHLGMGLGGRGYQSGRTNRPRPLLEDPFGTVTQRVAAAGLRGKRIRLRAAVRAEVSGADNQGQLWLRVDRPGGEHGFFDNMADRPVRSGEWKLYEITGEVAPDAEAVFFGCLLQGKGSVFVDAFELAVESGQGWQPIPIVNAGFETAPAAQGWKTAGTGYRFERAAERPFAGAAALRIVNDGTATTDEPLFAEAPALGEVWEGELVPGVRARVPLAVAGDRTATWPAAGAPFAALQHDLGQLDPASWSGADWRVRVADVAIAWNAIEHFYPYFDVVHTDWLAALRPALREALTEDDLLGFQGSLRRMVAADEDGHGTVYNTALARTSSFAPCLFDLVEGRVVVTAPDPAGTLHRGDVVETLDGRAAMDVLAERVSQRSGTPQWRRAAGLGSFAGGATGTTARLGVERDGSHVEVEVRRDGSRPASDHLLEPLTHLASGAWYVDLTRIEVDKVRPHVDELAAAPAVVFDMRGYPKPGAEEMLQHLTGDPLQSAIWEVPRITHPDHQGMTSWDRSGRWSLAPLAPRFHGKIAFLTGPGAISYAESVMGIVEAYRLGAIVGATTAGTNGNINMVALPGGYGLIFTGMKVLKHDGSQHHLVGIHPTLPAERTLAGVRAGRDEVLEAALQGLGMPTSTASAQQPGRQPGR